MGKERKGKADGKDRERKGTGKGNEKERQRKRKGTGKEKERTKKVDGKGKERKRKGKAVYLIFRQVHFFHNQTFLLKMHSNCKLLDVF